MGRSYAISCKNCDYKNRFITGIGMMYAPHNLTDFETDNPLLPSLIRSKKTIETIKSLLTDKGAVIADNYGHEIYSCPKCGEFHGRFFIHLDYDGGSYEAEYKCSKCKTLLELIKHDSSDNAGWRDKEVSLEKYPCPKCGTYSLSEDGEAIILWD